MAGGPGTGRAALLAAAFLLAAVPAAASPGAPVRPNILVFIADDVGRDELGPYGHPHARTPALDALARAGLRFDAAFLTTSSCSPSRCSILTGRYPHSTGAMELHQPLPPYQVTFVEILKDAGYYTASIGKWHLGYDAPRRFDKVIRDFSPSGADHWIEALRARPKGKPFFFWLAANDAHRPFEHVDGVRPYSLAEMVVPPFLPDIGETRTELALYEEKITRMDGNIAKALREIEAQGVASRTAVFFLSDDGMPFPRCKSTVYDSGIHAPLIVRFPGTVKPGGVSASLVSYADVAPTLLEIAGLRPHPSMQGRSFLPILRAPASSIRDQILAEHNWHDYAARERAVRTERYKYIRNFYPDLPGNPPMDVVRTITYQAMRRLRDRHRLPPQQAGCFLRPRPAEELYDLQADPFELHDLAGDPAQARTLDMMRHRLADWQRETGDEAPKERRPDAYDRETGEPLTPGEAAHD